MAKKTKADEDHSIEAGKTAATVEAKESKSIVPAKYAGKYKGGGQGPTSDFIRQVCGEGDKFEFPAFFQLCEKNGIPKEQIDKYKGEVEEKKNGANGRARMTLGNMLRAIARKNQKLVALNGDEYEVPEPAIKPSGAVAAKQAENEAAAA